MELNEAIIREALKKKGVTAKDMCVSIGLTEPSLYRFYKNGGMRVSTEKRIKEYLGIDTDVTNDYTSNVPDNISNDSSMVDKLLKRIEELSVEVFILKKQLGKYDSTLFALSA
jgi:transcriptional regulator with XRE-family HTH domain